MKTVIEMAIEAGADDLCIRYSEVFLKEFAALVLDNFNRKMNQACEEARLLDDGEKQQEPVAFMDKEGDFHKAGFHPDYFEAECVPLYNTPPTAAIAVRQMRDAAVKVCEPTHPRHCYTDDIWNTMLLIQAEIEALPVPDVQEQDIDCPCGSQCIKCSAAVLAEREACAKVCDELWKDWCGKEYVSAAIRARGGK